MDYGFAEEITPEQPSLEQLVLPSPVPDGPPLLLGSDADDVVTLATLKRHLMAQGDGDGSGDGNGDGGDGSGSDRAVCEALVAACGSALRQMPTSEEEDKEARSSPPEAVDSGRWRSIVNFRLGQKQHLRRYMY